MLELSCLSWVIIFLVVGVICFIGFNIARIKRDGMGQSNETNISHISFGRYKDNCNDDNSWTE